MIVLVFILGMCAGSFAYVLSLRLYDGRDWVRGRSECEHCKHKLLTLDLIPLVSWLANKGRCRHCGVQIGHSYPLVELATGLLSGFSYMVWPYGWGVLGTVLFVLWLVMLVILVALIISDIKWYLLPDKLVFPLVGLAIVQQLVLMVSDTSLDRFPGLLFGVLVGSGLFFMLYQLSSGRYIGGGDVKYGLYMGLLVGSGLKSALILSLASMLGTIVSLPPLIAKRKTMSAMIPFGPFLIISTVIVYLLGDKIVRLLSTVYLFP